MFSESFKYLNRSQFQQCILKLQLNLNHLLMNEMDSGSMNFLGIDLLLMEKKIQNALSNFKAFCDSFSQMCNIKITTYITDNC